MKSDTPVSHLNLSELAAIGRADRKHPHLEACELCRETAALIEGVREMGAPAGEPGSTEHRCIKEPEIGKLFEEPMEAPRALEVLRHAAGCGPCGRRLKELAFVFSPVEDESVVEIVNRLGSSTPEWQRATAKRLAGARRPSQGNWRRWAAAAAVLIAIAAGFSWNRLRELRVEQLLAQAYTDRRPFEFRLPDNGYAAVTQKMGAASLFQNPALTKAKADIVDLPETDPRTKWLRGRAELLDGDTDAAITQLENLELPGEERSLDLAVALALRGDPQKRTEDWGQALEYVSRYLAAHPASREGLYNKALLLERLQLVDDAIAAWDRYLEIDPTGPWAAEASRHKDELAKRKNAWQLRRDRLATDSLQLAGDAERYLGRNQLIRIRRQSPEVQTAVGDLLIQKHQDRFLRDLFEHWTPSTEAAFEHLARGFDAVGKDRYQAASEEYRQAESGFAAAGNFAGKYRASLERTYALQRAIQPRDCAALATQIRNELSVRNAYPWMQIQAEIQIAICAELGGGTADALSHLQQAQELAESSGYLGAGLRASGIYAESLTRLGDRSAAWTLGVRDMQRYWDFASDPSRAYQILMNQFWAAEKMGWMHAQALLGTAACREIGRIKELRDAELSCRIELSGVARRIGDERLASTQLQAAAKLADSIQEVDGPQSAAQKALIRYASALVDAGDLKGAADRLQRLESASNSDAFITRLQYLTAVGRLHLADHQTLKAEDAFDQAKRLIMDHLSGLAQEADQVETAEAASLYRLAMEAHIPASGTGNLRSEDLEAWENFRARVRAPAQSPESVSKLAPKLTEETVLILVRLRSGIAAWTVDSRGISSRWIPLDVDALDKSIRHMTELCADPHSRSSEIAQEGRRLYGWLIAPVADHLKGKNFIAIEPDESLSSVPFRALVTDSGDYWGKQAALEQIDSVADYLNRRSEPQPQQGGQTLLVSSPPIKGNLARLYPPLNFAGEPVSESDGRTIVRLPGREATLDNIAKNRDDANVFHFFGHATSRAESSALLVAAENGDAEFLLNANRVRSQNWSKTRLVVLSACSTAAGETFGPANRDGLVRGFLEAGAARVIASQWDVDAPATAELFRRFYDQIARSGDTARALQAAEIEIARDENTAHPYYWAAFNLYGTR